MAKHVWLVKPSQHKAEWIWEGYQAARKQKATPRQAVVFAGYYCERMYQGGAYKHFSVIHEGIHFKFYRYKTLDVLIESKHKQGGSIGYIRLANCVNASNYSCCVSKHSLLIDLLVLGPIYKELGVAINTPLHVIQDMLADLGEERPLLDEYGEFQKEVRKIDSQNRWDHLTP